MKRWRVVSGQWPLISGQWSVVNRLWSVVGGRWSAVGGLLLVICSLLLVACGGGQSTDAPPEILYGQDVCDACNMIISEEKFAAAYWTAEGEARRFDDLGEMLSYFGSNPEERAATWVHDLNTAAWLRAEEAWYVMNAGLTTPMGTGVVAVGDEAAARALAFDQAEARVMNFTELIEAAAAGEVGGMGGHGMGD